MQLAEARVQGVDQQEAVVRRLVHVARPADALDVGGHSLCLWEKRGSGLAEQNRRGDQSRSSMVEF